MFGYIIKDLANMLVLGYTKAIRLQFQEKLKCND